MVCSTQDPLFSNHGRGLRQSFWMINRKSRSGKNGYQKTTRNSWDATSRPTLQKEAAGNRCTNCGMQSTWTHPSLNSDQLISDESLNATSSWRQSNWVNCSEAQSISPTLRLPNLKHQPHTSESLRILLHQPHVKHLFNSQQQSNCFEFKWWHARP